VSLFLKLVIEGWEPGLRGKIKYKYETENAVTELQAKKNI
jgi:hypothetical protein